MTWESVRKVVLARDSNLCLWCLEPAEHVHHRKPKGIGGTSRPEVQWGLANLVSVCADHHRWIHEHPAEGYLSGFLVHSWDNPEDVPLLVKPGSVFLKLGSDGSLERSGSGLLF
jgi:5-methylcytosine-specific restriction enzyme A